MNKLNHQDILKKWQGVDRNLLPSFAIIGAMKPGTTSLYHYMNQHPDIYFPEIKEPGIFLGFSEHKVKMASNDVHIESIQQSINYLMQNYQGQAHIGEASTFYTKMPNQGFYAAQRFQLLKPKVKFIYLLRNPVDRLISHYQNNRVYLPVIKDFNRYIADYHRDILPVSLYFYQLSRFLQFFDLDSFLILTTDQLELEPEQTLQQVFEFLEIDSQFRCQNLTVKHHTNHKYPDKPKFNKQLYQQIIQAIKQDVTKLEFLLNKKFNWDFSAQKYT